MSTPSTSSLIPALVLPYLAWRVYRRFHRNVGRQLVHPQRLVTGIVIFGLLAAILLFFSLPMPLMLAGSGAGIVCGGLLAVIGLRLTKFEVSADPPHYYTPNTYIGVALTLLLAGRVLYRIGVIYFSGAAAGSSPSVMQSPLTLLILGLTAGYYIAYNSGVLIRSSRKPA
jgi:hypothetical protein